MNVYQIITNKIIEQLEKGCVPWHRPWSGTPKNIDSGKAYRGINHFLLGGADFSSPYWLTFKQCKNKGGHIKAGSKSSTVVFWKFSGKNTNEADEDEQSTSAPILRYYRVFNLDQCEGITAPNDETSKQIDFKPIEAAENIVTAYKDAPTLSHKGFRAFYRPSSDSVQMPQPESFDSEEEYYSTLFHELSHSVGHPKRLNRKSMSDYCPFGSTNYSKEELIAEMSAAFLCGEAKIENKTIDNSAAYIESWIRKFKDKPKMLILAAAQAQKAADYILNKNQDRKINP